MDIVYPTGVYKTSLLLVIVIFLTFNFSQLMNSSLLVEGGWGSVAILPVVYLFIYCNSSGIIF